MASYNPEEKEKIELLNNYNLSETSLETKISVNHLRRIEEFIHWEQVGRHLQRMESQDIEDIKKQESCESGRRRKLVALFKQRNGYKATYNVMVTAMLAARNVDDAGKVCELLQSPNQTREELVGTSSLPLRKGIVSGMEKGRKMSHSNSYFNSHPRVQDVKIASQRGIEDDPTYNTARIAHEKECQGDNELNAGGYEDPERLHPPPDYECGTTQNRPCHTPAMETVNEERQPVMETANENKQPSMETSSNATNSTVLDPASSVRQTRSHQGGGQETNSKNTELTSEEERDSMPSQISAHTKHDDVEQNSVSSNSMRGSRKKSSNFYSLIAIALAAVALVLSIYNTLNNQTIIIINNNNCNVTNNFK